MYLVYSIKLFSEFGIIKESIDNPYGFYWSRLIID